MVLNLTNVVGPAPPAGVAGVGGVTTCFWSVAGMFSFCPICNFFGSLIPLAFMISSDETLKRFEILAMLSPDTTV